jgi:hypothetical protein
MLSSRRDRRFETVNAGALNREHTGGIAPISNDNLRRSAASRRLAHVVDRSRGY